MTYVEFFDKNVADNICACLARVPERVVFVGNNTKVINKHIERYKSVFESKGYKNVEFVSRGVSPNKIDKIVEELSDIVQKYDDCVFGLTGGGDLYLVAMGMVFERFKDRNLQMHRFNLRSNTVYDCDHDGETVFEGDMPKLSVDDNIKIHGGKVVSSDIKSDGTFRWNFTHEFKRDILDMWDICRADSSAWNKQLDCLGAIVSAGVASEDGLSVSITRKQLEAYCIKNEKESTYNQTLINSLLEKKFLNVYSENNGRIHIEFKDQQIKRCLTVAGRILELRVTLAAQNALDVNGKHVYNDVLNGVYIDWDGEVHGRESDIPDTDNEIDVLAMHGMVPVFISCKNGVRIEPEELYKLNTVAERFGGSYAQKILVASSLGRSKAFRQRAQDMGIRIIDGIKKMTDEELEAILAGICNTNGATPKNTRK